MGNKSEEYCKLNENELQEGNIVIRKVVVKH